MAFPFVKEGMSIPANPCLTITQEKSHDGIGINNASILTVPLYSRSIQQNSD